MTKLTGYEKGGFVYKILNLYNLTCRPQKKAFQNIPKGSVLLVENIEVLTSTSNFKGQN